MDRSSGPRERIERALIVEDDQAMGTSLADALSDAGYDPVVVRGVDDARAAIREHAPAVLLLDLALDETFGTDLLEELSRAADAPVVVVVSGFQLADLVANKYGVELVKKPFPLEQLLETLERARMRDARPRRVG